MQVRNGVQYGNAAHRRQLPVSAPGEFGNVAATAQCCSVLQVCRVDGRIDAAFDERMTIEAGLNSITAEAQKSCVVKC